MTPIRLAVAAALRSEVWFGTVLYGVKSGLPVNAPYIGVAAVSIWFIGWMPCWAQGLLMHVH